jgi:hypothetical protein
LITSWNEVLNSPNIHRKVNDGWTWNMLHVEWQH